MIVVLLAPAEPPSFFPLVLHSESSTNTDIPTLPTPIDCCIPTPSIQLAPAKALPSIQPASNDPPSNFHHHVNPPSDLFQFESNNPDLPTTLPKPIDCCVPATAPEHNLNPNPLPLNPTVDCCLCHQLKNKEWLSLVTSKPFFPFARYLFHQIQLIVDVHQWKRRGNGIVESAAKTLDKNETLAVFLFLDAAKLSSQIQNATRVASSAVYLRVKYTETTIR